MTVKLELERAESGELAHTVYVEAVGPDGKTWRGPVKCCTKNTDRLPAWITDEEKAYIVSEITSACDLYGETPYPTPPAVDREYQTSKHANILVTAALNRGDEPSVIRAIRTREAAIAASLATEPDLNPRDPAHWVVD